VHKGARRRANGKNWQRPAIALCAVVLIALGIATAATKLLAHASAPVSRSSCQDLVVPAYFPDWSPLLDHRPADLILDLPNGVGTGSAPNAYYQEQVKRAKDDGITVLGYSSTDNGLRPMADVEADVRHYQAWYGITHIFLDVVSGHAAQFGYYQQLSGYIHQRDGAGSVWLNPGNLPDEDYMSIGDVVMVFEGTYAQYVALQMPSWVDNYPAAKFAHTIYDTSGADLDSALRLAAQRHAGHVFVTDGSGSNPYDEAPSYWPSESEHSCAGA